jgi:galactokinase
MQKNHFPTRDILSQLYGSGSVESAVSRLQRLEADMAAVFPGETPCWFFSSPGRTEVGGNHTDHQHGCVLAAAVNLDVVACVRPIAENVIRVQSEGYPMDVVSLSDLRPHESEFGSSAGLIRGVAAMLQQKGYRIGGFEAVTTSSVPGGSGLSSSAAFENLIGVILSYLYNGGGISAIELAAASQQAEVRFFGKACGLMDQMASAVGGFAFMDFGDPERPQIRPVRFDFSRCGYDLCIVATGGSHANLTGEYVAVPEEMRAVANLMGARLLREVREADFYQALPSLRGKVSDRALLRAMHFFKDSLRARREAEALEQGDFAAFLQLVARSGASSFQYLQNVYPASAPQEQGLSLALALTDDFISKAPELGGAFRVHGGGFAGTIQCFIPISRTAEYKTMIERLFGEGACHVLSVRNTGCTIIR